MPLADSPISKFIKKYPRIFSLGVLIIIVLIFVLPVPFGKKLLILLRTLLIGFLIAAGWVYRSYLIELWRKIISYFNE